MTGAIGADRPGSGSADLEPEEVEAKAREVAQFIQHLLKGIKNIGIYRHAEGRFVEFLGQAYNTLTAFLSTEDSLPLKLTPYTLEYKKHVVYEDQNKENLTYKFYRDGMRFLMFRAGVPADELLRFVLLAMETPSEKALFQEDMVTRLWKQEFKFIEYVLLEGFNVGEEDPNEVEVEVEKIVGYLQKQLAANGEDIARFARLSVEDLQLQLEDVEQVRGGIISGRTALPDDINQIQEELLAEEKSRLFAKMVLILFQILEHDASKEDTAFLSDGFVQVLDTLLLTEDVKGSVAMLARLDKLVSEDGPRRDIVLEIRNLFRQKMIEPQRLDAVGRYIALSRKLDEAAVREYLAVCDEQQLVHLTDMLVGMERAEGRLLLIDLLAELGRDHAEVFARRLDSNASNVVKDMLAIIQKIDPPDKMKMISRLLEHPNIMIRLEGLKMLAKSKDEAALRFIEKAMEDPDLQIRLGAYRALAIRGGARAVPPLSKLMQSEAYPMMDQREKLAIAASIGETKSKEALKFFSSLFEQKATLFSRARVNDLKFMAIAGLKTMGTLEAFRVLAREVQNTNNAKEVLEAAHKAATRLKQELSGVQPAEPRKEESNG